MREQTIIHAMQSLQSQIDQIEKRLGGVYKVLQEIIGKELLRGQALHKVLMDKAIFTDAELKVALEKLIEEGKADMKKIEEEAQAAKAQALNLLVPASANLTPPTNVEEAHVTPVEVQNDQPPTAS